MILIILSVVFFVLYLLLIVIFSYGWEQLSYQSHDVELKVDISFPVTVIVPLNNEEQNLDRLFKALEEQTFKRFTTIFVNDHSYDTSKFQLSQFQSKYPDVIIIDATGHGKKNAIREGIKVAKDGLIVTTDADCLPANTWLESIILYQQKEQCDLVIGPVKMAKGKSLFSKLQQLEFASLVASGAGAAGVGMPLMCNGANLAFTKDAWLQSQHDLMHETASGDDMFLLQSVKKQKGEIRFLLSEKAMVETQSAKDLRDFINQRKRWASKSTKYTDWQIISVAIIVFAVSLLQIFLLIGSISNMGYLWCLAGIFISKYLADYLLLNIASAFFGLKQTALLSLVLSVVYPFYIVGVAIAGFFHPKAKW